MPSTCRVLLNLYANCYYRLGNLKEVQVVWFLLLILFSLNSRLEPCIFWLEACSIRSCTPSAVAFIQFNCFSSSFCYLVKLPTLLLYTFFWWPCNVRKFVLQYISTVMAFVVSLPFGKAQKNICYPMRPSWIETPEYKGIYSLFTERLKQIGKLVPVTFVKRMQMQKAYVLENFICSQVISITFVFYFQTL